MLILDRRIFSVAFCNGEVANFGLAGSPAERERVCALLNGLSHLGRVAAWRVGPMPEALAADHVVDALAGRVGRLAVGAVLAAPQTSPEPQPAWLMPISAFDNVAGQAPAATARLFGLDLEVVAVRSKDEELGLKLPGHDGLWVLRALPFGTDG